MNNAFFKVFHIFPLPYHHNSFFVSQLVPFIFDLERLPECDTGKPTKASAVIVKPNKEWKSTDSVH